MDHDLVVIGCGAGGLAAAVAYADLVGRDARIAVLERATREARGGATRWTSSWFRITADRQLDPAFIETMQRVTGGKADLEYCRAYAREVPATFDFLDRHGVPWIYFEQPFANRNTGGGLGMPVPGGVAIVDTLAKVVDALPNAAIHYETEAVALSTDDDGGVSGVQVRGPDGRQHLAARAVVIACGGFEGAPDMLREHLGPRGAELPLIAPTLVNNRGDGIRLTAPLGADLAGQFDMFHGEPVDRRSSKPDAVVYAYPYGIVVNRDAYEAIWLHATGGNLSYAPPVYKTPIIMRPEALSWLSTLEAGVSVKHIGVFPHRGLSLNAWRIEPGGRYRVPAVPALRLLFVTDGTGAIGPEALRRWSAVRLRHGEEAELLATGRLEILELAVQSVGDLKRNPSLQG